jgi:hypothetical protein
MPHRETVQGLPIRHLKRKPELCLFLLCQLIEASKYSRNRLGLPVQKVGRCRKLRDFAVGFCFFVVRPSGLFCIIVQKRSTLKHICKSEAEGDLRQHSAMKEDVSIEYVLHATYPAIKCSEKVSNRTDARASEPEVHPPITKRNCGVKPDEAERPR